MAKQASVREGSRVAWNWAGSTASGKVKSVFHEKTTRRIKGSEVTRHGGADNPALYIEQDDGDTVLKLLSEVEMK
jgi:hypothetical protein